MEENFDQLSICQTREHGKTIDESRGETRRGIEMCEVAAGNVGINVGIVAPMSFFPFGGRKDSFFGVVHGQGRDVIRFFVDPKIVIERWF